MDLTPLELAHMKIGVPSKNVNGQSNYYNSLYSRPLMEKASSVEVRNENGGALSPIDRFN